MTPDIFDFILSELGLDDGSDPCAQRAVRQPASPCMPEYILTHPDEKEAPKRQHENAAGALRATANCANAKQAQKHNLIWDRENAVRRSRENV